MTTVSKLRAQLDKAFHAARTCKAGLSVHCMLSSDAVRLLNDIEQGDELSMDDQFAFEVMSDMRIQLLTARRDGRQFVALTELLHEALALLDDLLLEVSDAIASDSDADDE